MLPMLLILAAPLAEPPPGHFYNRPGATLAMRDTALRQCRAITTGPMVETSRPLTPPIGTAPDLPRPYVRTADTIGECMTMAGWNLYALSPREQARWRRLSESARSGLLERWTGALRPTWGRFVRKGRGAGLLRGRP